MLSPLILWAALAAALPPGSVAVVELGPPTEHTHALAELIRARGRVAWGRDAIVDRPAGARFVVEIEAGTSAACELLVREGGAVLAARRVDWEAVDLALLEGWVMVRSTVERGEGAALELEAEDEVIAVAPGPARAAETTTTAVTTELEAAGLAGEPPPLDPTPPIDAAPAADAGTSTPALADTHPATPSPGLGLVDVPAGRPDLVLDELLAVARLIDAFGVGFSSQLSGASSAGLAVHARKTLAPRVIATARLGVEWSSPLTDVSTVRLPLTGMVGWVPWVELPLELGAQVQLTPIFLRSDQGGSGLGLGASVGGYSRGSLQAGPFTLFGELGLAVPVLRHTYSTTTETAADPVLDLRFAAGVEWRWP